MTGRWLLALLEAAVVVEALTGCGVSVGAPADAERQALAAKRASIVLLRLLATHDGHPVNFLGNVDVLNVLTSGGYILLVENVETGDQTKLARPRTPSAEAERDGWIYLVLEPGRYHVIVKPWPLGEISRPFLLSVPSTPTVVYAGSLPIACGEPGLHQGPNLTRSSFPRGMLTTMPTCLPPVAVADESEPADRVAHISFSQYGPLTTILMRGL